MQPKSILITGNMGYVGPNVVRRLRNVFPDATLTGLDTGYFAHSLTGADCFPETQLDAQVFCDIRDFDEALLEGVDAVVCLAAISNDPMGNVFEAATHEINLAAGKRLANLAKRHGVNRFVFASSCSVYGTADDNPRRETDEVAPLTAYARSKIDMEGVLAELADETFQTTSLRFPTACGMSDRLRLDLVLNDFVASAVATQKIEILSDGTPWRPLIDTQDMARAIEWGLVRETTPLAGSCVAVNVGIAACNYQIRELAETVAAEMTNVDVFVNKDAAPDKRSYQVDFSLYAQIAPDHLPRISLSQSVGELAEGLQRMRFGDAEFRTSHLMRLRVLEHLKTCGRLDDALRWTVPQMSQCT